MGCEWISISLGPITVMVQTINPFTAQQIPERKKALL